MVRKNSEYLDNLIDFVQSNFEDVCVTLRDESIKRAVLNLECRYGTYRIAIREIITSTSRVYSYYVLSEAEVIYGFDNAADVTALRLKYTDNARYHQGELTPHCHTEGKRTLLLTEEYTCQKFFEWIRVNVSK
ncbi:hypothetical protein FJZ31_40950 [Candidatus Poribacteria bacterium]|nr:hypothetical protein [Candidatus Poribacteria bacterium]